MISNEKGRVFKRRRMGNQSERVAAVLKRQRAARRNRTNIARRMAAGAVSTAGQGGHAKGVVRSSGNGQLGVGQTAGEQHASAASTGDAVGTAALAEDAAMGTPSFDQLDDDDDDENKTTAETYADQLCVPEWLLDVPADLGRKVKEVKEGGDEASSSSAAQAGTKAEQLQHSWFCMPRPEGKRCIVISAHGWTVSRHVRTGFVLHKFRSELPNGSVETMSGGRSGEDGVCILDCIYQDGSGASEAGAGARGEAAVGGAADTNAFAAVGTYHVIDLLCWKGFSLFDCTAAFRLFWLRTKLAEDYTPVRQANVRAAMAAAASAARLAEERRWMAEGGGFGGSSDGNGMDMDASFGVDERDQDGDELGDASMEGTAAAASPERRYDTDGRAYTREQFVQHYGGEKQWEAAEGRDPQYHKGNKGRKSNKSRSKGKGKWRDQTGCCRHSFRAAPYYESSSRGVWAAYRQPLPFVRDGVLFFSSQAHHEQGPRPSPVKLLWKDALCSRYFGRQHSMEVPALNQTLSRASTGSSSSAVAAAAAAATVAAATGAIVATGDSSFSLEASNPVRAVLRVAKRPVSPLAAEGATRAAPQLCLETLDGTVVREDANAAVAEHASKAGQHKPLREGDLFRFSFTGLREVAPATSGSGAPCFLLEGLKCEGACGRMRGKPDSWSKLLFQARARSPWPLTFKELLARVTRNETVTASR